MEITMAAARAIVRKYNQGLITNKSTGEEGPIKITSNWAKSMLYHMKFVKKGVVPPQNIWLMILRLSKTNS